MKRTLLSACLATLMLYKPAFCADLTWISNVKLVSPEKLDRIETGSVLIDGGRITRVERGPAKAAPSGAKVVDGKGYYLTPGLIDSHVHLHAVPGMSMEQGASGDSMAQNYFRQMPRSFLYHGFTTVIDLAVSDYGVIDRFRKEPLHPDVFHCGEALVLANGYPMSFMTPDTRFKSFGNFLFDPAMPTTVPAEFAPATHTVAAGVARVVKAGGICVKTHFERGFGANRNLPVMSSAKFAEVRAATAQAGKVLVTHANSFEAQSFAVAGKADVLAHGMWHWGALNGQAGLPNEIKALLDKIVDQRTGYQPTMQVLYGLRAYVEPGYLNDPALRKVVPASLLAWFSTPEGQWFKPEVTEGEDDAAVMQGMEGPLRRQRAVVAYLAGRDANFVFGSDTPSSPTYGNLPGLNGYREMQQLHAAGMSLAQIFKAATINNARTFKLDAELGSIEVGKAANLLLMKTSPLEDVSAYDSVVTVWVRGQQTAREALAADYK
ncbi:amidohydrolase family protein [Massilia antarctica]|uniref:amidohydrolase family protein n=1 Tax=Massilia antarctica TaxID=2765360 RepID=UPI0006BB5C3A|nr:amidohydrolase family protein [Massilia sp. H27-R4]MCY0913521.1 amidohydrolase family protein [Massilia sp. H27-R4]CUI09659.1 amidohydrolase [Janthinobacterium sp. CG23_2]CUU33445.1 amidohydrolase [Janthinobacterium sp. CG23_2]